MLFPWGYSPMPLSSKHLILFAPMLFAGCVAPGEGPMRPDRRAEMRPEFPMRGTAPMAMPGVSDANVVLGEPYELGGKTITPADIQGYDETGYASISMRGGGATANGEAWVATQISAAHPTLPMPSYVEVTHLETGRTILVRVNDRGPMAVNQILALSPAAAQQLGVTSESVFAVRVRRTSPPESERAMLRSGRTAPERIATPPALLTALRRRLGEGGVRPPAGAAPIRVAPAPVTQMPPAAPRGNGPGADFDAPIAPRFANPGTKRPPARPAPTRTVAPPQAPLAADADGFVIEEQGRAPMRQPAAASNGWFVQIGAFGDVARARSLAAKLGAQVVAAGEIWRVRLGPYPSAAAAGEALGDVQAKGYPEARVTSR